MNRRVTPDALASYAAPRPNFPLGSVVCATLVAWLALPVWSVAVMAATSLRDLLFADEVTAAHTLEWIALGGGFSFGMVVLVVGAIPAAVLGVPCGAGLVYALRAAPRAWHRVAFLALGAGVGWLGALVVGVSEFGFLVPATALASATGWFVMRRRLVGWRGDVGVGE